MTAPRFNQHDVVLIDGIRTTILSWPADNEGPFYWEQYSESTKGYTQGTSYASQVNITGTEEKATPSFGVPVVSDPTVEVDEPAVTDAPEADASVDAPAVDAAADTE